MDTLAQMGSPMDGLDPSIEDLNEPKFASSTVIDAPETVSEPEIESTLVIDEEADEAFEWVATTEEVAETQQNSVNDTNANLVAYPTTSLGDDIWSRLRPYATALWKLDDQHPGLVKALEETIRLDLHFSRAHLTTKFRPLVRAGQLAPESLAVTPGQPFRLQPRRPRWLHHP